MKENKVVGLIPCRLNSSRLPKKALLDIGWFAFNCSYF